MELLLPGVIHVDRHPSRLIENGTTQGIYMVFGVAGSLFLARSFKRFSWLFYFSALFFMGFIFFAGQSFSAYIAALVFTLYFCVRKFWRRRLLFTFFASFGALLFWYLAPQNFLEVIGKDLFEFNKFLAGEATEAYSTSIRYIFWSNTLEMIWDNFFVGVGAGSFAAEYRDLISNDSGWRALPTDDPHSQYLHLAAQYGILSIGILVFGLTKLFVKFWDEADSVYELEALLVVLLVTSIVNGHFGSFVEGRLWWILVGVSTGYVLSKQERYINRG